MRFTRTVFLLATVAAAGLTAAARADLANDFSTNPIGAAGVTVQGLDAAHVNSRFTYNSGDGTLTAHYNTTADTIKLLFDLGQHFNQNSSFVYTARLELPSAALGSPPDFGGSVASFGLINSATTGNARASTGYFDGSGFHEVTKGDTYDLLTLDYFPTQDPSFGGNSLSLTSIQSAQNGVAFNDSFRFGFALASLPTDQFFDVTVTYNGSTHLAHMDYGSGSVDADLTGAAFDVNSFAITLWNDPNLTAQSPAFPSGSPVTADAVFDSFSVTATPEPSSAALLGGAALLLLARRRRLPTKNER